MSAYMANLSPPRGGSVRAYGWVNAQFYLVGSMVKIQTRTPLRQTFCQVGIQRIDCLLLAQKVHRIPVNRF